MADKTIGVHLKDWHIVQGVRTGNSPWSPIAIAQVPVKEPAPSAPTIESVAAPEASAGVLEIKVGLPETNVDGTALARAELVRLRLHHSTSPGVTESDPYVDFPPSETLLWAPNDTVTHYVRVRVQDSHGLWSELSNEASGQANAATVPQEDSGLWAHRLGVESIFTNDSPEPGYVSWSNVVLYWRNNKYEIEDGSTNKKYIWWDYSTSTTTFQTSDTRPELDLEDVIIGYNDNGTWRLMCYQPTVMADYVRAGVLQSSNWGATTGSQLDLDKGTLKLGGSDSPKFQVDADGVLHATGAVIEGALTAGEGSSIDGAYIEEATITSAKISDLTFDKITAGTNTASLTIGSGGYIQSANYSAGSSGFRISGSGNAEFNDVIVRGALITQSGSDLNADYITTGTITAINFRTAASGYRVEIGPSGTYPHNVSLYDSNGDLAALLGPGTLSLGSSGSTKVFLSGGGDGLIWTDGMIRPNTSGGAGYIGDATYYWYEVNAKAFTDRGCLGAFDNGATLPDGRVVSDVEALKAIRVLPDERTPYGKSRLDYSSFPLEVQRQAPVAEKDTVVPRKDGTREIVRKGEKLGDDGIDLSALVSLLIGAIKELDRRLAAVEGKNNSGR